MWLSLHRKMSKAIVDEMNMGTPVIVATVVVTSAVAVVVPVVVVVPRSLVNVTLLVVVANTAETVLVLLPTVMIAAYG